MYITSNISSASFFKLSSKESIRLFFALSTGSGYSTILSGASKRRLSPKNKKTQEYRKIRALSFFAQNMEPSSKLKRLKRYAKVERSAEACAYEKLRLRLSLQSLAWLARGPGLVEARRIRSNRKRVDRMERTGERWREGWMGDGERKIKKMCGATSHWPWPETAGLNLLERRICDL